jgi:heat shock protein HtpX
MINQAKTVILLALLTALLLFVGQMLGGYGGLVIAVFFVLIFNGVSYFWSHKIVLMMYKAKEVDEKHAPRLYKLVREVVNKANIPMPKVYIIPANNANAFATGRNPEHGIVACTKGILSLLDDEELKGVIAHECSHIKNRDILIQTIAGMIAGVISYVAIMARWGAIFGGFGRDRDSGNLIHLLVLGILTPIIAMLIQLAISRSREYLADESAAKILGNSNGLTSALAKLSNDAKQHPMQIGNQSTAHLFIVNPFKGGFLVSLLSTHPPMNKRIERLKSMNF